MGRAIASIVVAALVVQTAVSANEEEALTNEDILVMTEAGLTERVIVAKIMASETDFDTSREELVELSSAGVGASVLEAMVKKTSPAAGPRSTNTYAQRFEGTPCPASGLYVEDQHGDLRVIDPQVPQLRRGNTLLPAVTGGIIPAKAKASVRGARSDMRTRSPTPTFWFCPADLDLFGRHEGHGGSEGVCPGRAQGKQEPGGARRRCGKRGDCRANRHSAPPDPARQVRERGLRCLSDHAEVNPATRRVRVLPPGKPVAGRGSFQRPEDVRLRRGQGLEQDTPPKSATRHVLPASVRRS